MIPKFNSPDFQYIEPTYKDRKYCGLTSVKSQIVSTNTFNHQTDFCYSYKTQKDALSMEIQQKNVLMFLVSKSLPLESTILPQAYIFLEVVAIQTKVRFAKLLVPFFKLSIKIHKLWALPLEKVPYDILASLYIQ